MISLMRCYAMAVPIIVWAFCLQFGWVEADSSRVPYLLIQGVAIIISVHGLQSRYRELK